MVDLGSISNLLIQIPLVALFVWFVLHLRSQEDCERKRVSEERSEERMQFLEALNTCSRHLDDVTEKIEALTSQIAAMSARIQKL